MSNFLQIIPLHQAFCDYSLTFKGNTKATIRWLKQSINELTRSQQITELPQATRNSIEE